MPQYCDRRFGNPVDDATTETTETTEKNFSYSAVSVVSVVKSFFCVQISVLYIWSGKRDSNPRPSAWKADALAD